MAHETHRSRFTTGLLVLAVACLIAPGSASATHTLLEFESALEELWAVDPAIEPPPDNGRRDFAVGGFQFQNTALDAAFGFSAHSGPLGEDPRGHFTQTFRGDQKARASVVCLAV
jgi:hypothetical protein